MHPRHFEEDMAKAQKDVAAGRLAKPPNRSINFFMGLFLALILVMMVVPYYAVRIDPTPKNIPTLPEVIPSDLVVQKIDHSSDSTANLNSYIVIDSQIKTVTDRVVTASCPHDDICYAKALFLFVRDNFQYVSDPAAFEYIKTAQESLASKGGDCDDASVLLATLLNSVGIDTRFVFVPGHVYVEAFLPDARKKYRGEDDMVALDPTCASCGFGEVPLKNMDVPKRYLE